jgi:adenylate cyclase class IV
MNSSGIEAEIKIPVADIETVREALVEARATKAHAMAREINLLLDTVDGRLQDAGNILRLRRYGSRNILTFKGPAVYRDSVKERPEHETEI